LAHLIRRAEDDAAGSDDARNLRINEVFSPEVHTRLKGAVGVAGQGFSGSSATSGAALDAASRQAALDTSLA